MREARILLMPQARLCLKVLCAETFADRLRGLLGREPTIDHHALWISPCSAVHTFGMRRPLDLVFVDRHDRVLRVDSRVAPRRMRCCSGARGVLELGAGSAAALGFGHPAVRLAWLEAPR